MNKIASRVNRVMVENGKGQGMDSCIGIDFMVGGASTENGRVGQGPSWVKRWERGLTKVLGWKPAGVFSGQDNGMKWC